jgi:hypothetical protein
MGMSVYSSELEEKTITNGDISAKVSGTGETKKFIIRFKEQEFSLNGEKEIKDFQNFVNDNF